MGSTLLISIWHSNEDYFATDIDPNEANMKSHTQRRRNFSIGWIANRNSPQLAREIEQPRQWQQRRFGSCWILLVTACLILLTGNGQVAAQKPLKVFILVGQSNMQGHAKVGTFEHIGMDPQTAPLLNEMQLEDGTPRICENVWISYLSSTGEKRGQLTAGFGADENKIGPELTFGIYTQKRVDEPILVIKTAWGGKSLNTDFRPPSAGPYEFNE